MDYLTPLVALMAVLAAFIVLFLKYKKDIAAYKKENVELIKKYHKELSFRKSSEVRLGFIGENLAPFTKCWPWDPSGFRFLGNPVDGIQFNNKEIIFVEIKTGNARLSKNQKQFKKLVQEGKVSFVTFKIGEDGIKLIRDDEVVEN